MCSSNYHECSIQLWLLYTATLYCILFTSSILENCCVNCRSRMYSLFPYFLLQYNLFSINFCVTCLWFNFQDLPRFAYFIQHLHLTAMLSPHPDIRFRLMSQFRTYVFALWAYVYNMFVRLCSYTFVRLCSLGVHLCFLGVCLCVLDVHVKLLYFLY